MRRILVITHFAIDESDLQRIRDCLLFECNVSHMLARDEIERKQNKQCDSWTSRCAAHIVIKGLQAVGQETHVGRLFLELGDVSLSHPLQLRRVAQQILTCASCLLPLKPGSLLLLEDVDQAGIDEIGLLHRGGVPRLELGPGGLHQRSCNCGKLAFDQARKRCGSTS